MKRKITLVLLSFVMIFTFAFAIGSIKKDKTLALANWSATSGITCFTTSGEEVFTTNSNTCELAYTGDLTGAQGINTISADFCYTGNSSTDRENVGFRLGCSTKYYNVNVWPNTASNGPAVLMIQQDSEDPINRIFRYEIDKSEVTQGKWFNLAVVADNGYLAVFLNGNLITWNGELGHAMGTFDINLLKVVTNGCPAQFKVKEVKFTDTNTILFWTKSSNVNYTTLNNVPMYSTGSDRAVIPYTGTMNNKNTISVNMNYSGAVDGYGYSGLKLYNGSEYYIFCVFPNTGTGSPPVAFMMHNTEDPINRVIRTELDSTIFGANMDFTLKVVIQPNYFEFLLNDKLIGSAGTTGYEIGDFNLSKIEAVSFKSATTFSNFYTGYSTPDMSGIVDFEFNVSGTTCMTATNATLNQANGALVASVTGANTEIASPVIDVIAGHKYSAKLSVKNTILVKLKNNTNANSVTLYFTDRVNTAYDNAKSKTFAITPNSGWKTYYFNISDVNDCKDWETNDKLKACNHYLREFKLAFNNSNSGSIEIDAITFEREDRIYEKAATSLTCVADKATSTVTVSGTLRNQYSGQTVFIIRSSIKNYNQFVNYEGNVLVASAKANGTSFSVSFPLENGDMTHLSSWFLASVGEVSFDVGAKVWDMFQIENWRDFGNNPYAFTTKSLSVKVTDYGAIGDGVTNNDVAIQSAIDYVSSTGGGKVILPGDTSNPYGNRYSTTGIELKSNVELCIEKGAVLLQSQRISEYTKYKLYLNHDDMGSAPVPWGFSGLMHYPLVYIHDVSNVKVTGGGEIRMADPGSEWLDGNGYTWDSNIHIGCSSYPTLIPIGIYAVSNIEVSDITISRSGGWHMYIRETNNGYFANINMTEMNCINTDGFDFSTAVHDVVVERNSLYSNDDALTLCITTSDPRDDYSIWRERSTKEDVSVYNFEIRYNNIYGGHGITFIPWASGYQNFGKAEIYNIKVYDNVVGGYATAVGDWQDNPFYGESNVNNYTQAEDNDYSPVRDIYICNNIYDGATILTTGVGMSAVQKVTNFISDCNIYSSDTFLNGNFDKNLRYDGEKDWTTGLSNWSRIGTVGTEVVGTKQAKSAKTGNVFTINDYAGFIKGNGELFQGLYKTAGSYTFTIKVKLTSGSAKLFARSSSGEIIAEKVLSANSSLTSISLNFALLGNMTVQLGVSHTGASNTVCYIDDASVATYSGLNYDYSFNGKEYPINADSKVLSVYSAGSGVTLSNGNVVTDAGAEYKIMVNNTNLFRNAEIKVTIGYSTNFNAGIYLLANSVETGADKISAYNIHIEGTASSYNINLYRFKSGFNGRLAQSSTLSTSGDVTLRVLIKNDNIIAFIGSSQTPVLTYEINDNLRVGNVGLRAQYTATTFSNFTIKTTENLSCYGDRTNLDALITQAQTYNAKDYSVSSFNTLTVALNNAKALGLNSYQIDIDTAYTNLNNAIKALAKCTFDTTNYQKDTTHHWHLCTDCQKSSEKVAHTYNQKTQAHKATDATCTSAATYYYTCVCGAVGTTTYSYGKPLDHNYNQKTQAYKATDATCTKAATYYYTCSCGAKGTETYSYGSVDNTKHNVGAWVEEIPATCFENGTKGHYYCSDCEKNLDKNKNEITNLTILSSGHDYGTWIEEIPAQVGIAGTKGHYHCSKCNKDYDINYEEIIDLVIPALPVESFSSSSSESSQESSSATSESEQSSSISQEQSSTSDIISSSDNVSSTEQNSSSSSSVNSSSKTPKSTRGGCSGNIGISVFLLPMLALALVFIVRISKKQ